MYVNLDIFKAYDVRGRFPEEINAKSAYIISRAFIEFIRSNLPAGGKSRLRVVVGSDARPSSPELKRAVIEGLLDEGVSVIDMGYATSPFHYYSVFAEDADGGIMVTASHNAYQDNGLKFTRKGGESIGDGFDIMKNISKRGIFAKQSVRGEIMEKNLHREYIDFLFSQVDLSRAGDMHVVVDAGGGMTTLLLQQLVKRLPCKMTIINGDLFFDLAHPPLNPIKEESLATLKNTVLEKSADFGVAFDADGDRSGFVTRNARYFRADYVGAFFAREFLKKYPGAAIVYDVRASSIFRETILQSGGRALESRVGHRFIKDLMRKEQVLFAAELSGHFYFQNADFMDSDFLPLLYFLQFVSQLNADSDAILTDFEVYPSSGEMNFEIKRKEGLLENIAGHFKDARETKWLDGLSIYYDDWWANIRMSNTEPLVRLNVEARTPERLKEKIAEIKTLLV